jgi:hypothetical protein
VNLARQPEGRIPGQDVVKLLTQLRVEFLVCVRCTVGWSKPTDLREGGVVFSELSHPTGGRGGGFLARVKFRVW